MVTNINKNIHLLQVDRHIYSYIYIILSKILLCEYVSGEQLIRK